MEEVVVIVVCLFLNALLAAYEMAFVSVPRPELRKQAKSGSTDASRLLKFRENPERTLSVIQIGITLVSAISAAVGGAGAAESIEPYLLQNYSLSENAAEFISIIVVVLPLTYFSVVVGELVPKSLALRHALKISLFGAPFLFIGDRILAPVVTLLEVSTKYLLRIFFPRSKGVTASSSSTLEIDALSQHHQEAVLNLAHIEKKKVNDILVPWKEVNTVGLTDSPDDIVSAIFASGHTRLPVIDGTKVIGILHTKEFLAIRETGQVQNWKAIIHPLLHAQPSDSILNVLRQMQSKRSHMSVIQIQDATPEGIVTFEDISEEIWGDIFDEDEDSRVRQVFADRVKRKLKPPPV